MSGGPIDLPRLLTEREAAEALGVSVYTIQRLRKQGEIRFKRLGGRWKTRADWLKEYLDREDNQCLESERKTVAETVPARSLVTGSAGGTIHPTGAPPGSIRNPDRQSAAASARLIFGSRKAG
ncbi:helix-turn-helix domain-containing protein [Oceanibaculum sp.]|uniref:helix-turn-helix domain-containing protein n=1 Tax=Oceanibaculum sp. TaxID=1903597 RepID=UPI00258E1F9D|nr:helix-turn-helix domain-containing protein [Oceanibaculum sp.]MCH2394324.1 helix-turn-helix domain-containing protein [Oceanibaculum sp.]